MISQMNDIKGIIPAHSWLKKIHICPIAEDKNPLVRHVTERLLEQFRHLGHEVQAQPDAMTDVLLSSAGFNEPLDWREAPLFTSRRRFGFDHTPAVFTIMAISAEHFQAILDRLTTALSSDKPNPDDFKFPGLAPQAYQVLIEQGLRGGPILALERLIQAQSKSIRVLLVVGDDEPVEAYLFDLVGAHPRILADDLNRFYHNLVLRMVTALSTYEVTKHGVKGPPIRRSLWEGSASRTAMIQASREFSKRGFFTPMIRIADLVEVPSVGDAVASQYSEGCFAAWDSTLNGLIATVTGSARPVDKGEIGDEDLAVIVGLQPGGVGVLVRHVEGKRNDPPSSEAVEMMDMDTALPRITLGPEWGVSAEVPVIRSKLHGHRGVLSYDLKFVEHGYLDPPYYHYPVSCATEAQAKAVKTAFSHSKALQNPGDPRQVVFTILPGHGTIIVEKWVEGKKPFQLLWEYMDLNFLEIGNRIPQGPLSYTMDHQGRMILLPL